jgi:hypothetical protein
MGMKKSSAGDNRLPAAMAAAIVAHGVLSACQSQPVSNSYYDQYDCVRNCDGRGGADHHGGGF